MRARRWCGPVLVAAGLAVVAAGFAAAGAGQLTPADRHELLERFTPILDFHPEEAWAPVKVERFLHVARVERQATRGSWTRAATPLPTSNVGCALTPCYRFNLPCALKSGAACYEKAAP